MARSIAYREFAKEFIEQCIENMDKPSLLLVKEEAEEKMGEFPSRIQKEVNNLVEDEFGRKLIKEDILQDFIASASDNGWTISEMWVQLENNRKGLEERGGEETYFRIAEWIHSFKRCPVCENELFFDSHSSQKYCPVC